MGMISTKKVAERVILIGVISQGVERETAEEHIKELEFLVHTAGGVVEKKFTQKLERPDPRTFVGTGKLAEILEYIKVEEIDLAVFDDELTPSQLRNIEKSFECKVLDRTNLILDIFAKRARTANARTQVELAQYQYLLPRLTRMWTHLERQRGGIGMRGPGETEIETDRRIIRDKIALLRKRLKDIDKQKVTQRGNRGKMVRVALVGYTNVGKSTIMNILSKSEVFAENKLFATLDTTVRKVVIENLPFLLTDTVGFIRKLPHGLVDSFKSTLDEVREADLLLHVVDISHAGFESQVEVVNQTLNEIGTADKPSILVFNKIDAYKPVVKEADDPSPITKENFTIEDWEKTWMANNRDCKTLFVSAKKKANWEQFRNTIYAEVRKIHVKRFPYNSFLYEDYSQEQ